MSIFGTPPKEESGMLDRQEGKVSLIHSQVKGPALELKEVTRKEIEAFFEMYSCGNTEAEISMAANGKFVCMDFVSTDKSTRRITRLQARSDSHILAYNGGFIVVDSKEIGPDKKFNISALL